jgi:hypothetical protein
LTLAGTAVASLLLHSPAGDRSRVTVQAAPGADLQASLVRLPPKTARLSLRPVALGDSGKSLRLELTAHDTGVVLDAAAWERLVPAANRPEDTSYRPDTSRADYSRAWFGDPGLKVGETRTSAAIALPGACGPGDALVFKVAATDMAGHRLAAWALVQLPNP